MHNLLICTIVALLFSGCAPCGEKKKESQPSSTTSQWSQPSVNRTGELKMEDGQKVEIGQKINYHLCTLVEAGQGYAIYRYTDQNSGYPQKTWLMTMSNGVITKIQLQ